MTSFYELKVPLAYYRFLHKKGNKGSLPRVVGGTTNDRKLYWSQVYRLEMRDDFNFFITPIFEAWLTLS